MAEEPTDRLELEINKIRATETVVTATQATETRDMETQAMEAAMEDIEEMVVVMVHPRVQVDLATRDMEAMVMDKQGMDREGGDQGMHLTLDMETVEDTVAVDTVILMAVDTTSTVGIESMPVTDQPKTDLDGEMSFTGNKSMNKGVIC